MKPKKEVPQLDLSFIKQDDWRKLMNEWVQYHVEIGHPYKSKRGIMACYSHLVRLSGGNIETAYLIVEQSEANNYQGLFPLKQEYGKQGNYQGGNNGYGNSGQRKQNASIDDVADEVLRRYTANNNN